jgi:hypothetical protein
MTVVHNGEERVDTVELASKIHWGGRVQQIVIDAPVSVTGYKVNRTFSAAIGDMLDTSATSPQLHQDGLRYNKGFGIDKSGKRKNEGFPGDEGERSAKDLNWRELVIFDLSSYLTSESVSSVTLNATPCHSKTFSGQLFVLDDTLSVVEIIQLSNLGGGAHTLNLSTKGVAVALNVISGSVQVGMSLTVN